MKARTLLGWALMALGVLCSLGGMARNDTWLCLFGTALALFALWVLP